MGLYEQIIASLRVGWERVLQNSEMAGTDGVSVPMFALRLEHHLAQLEAALRARTYRADPLFAFDIPKPTGGMRRLAVPTVRDRVVQGAALEVLGPVLEKSFEAGSFAYRPGRSYQDAIRKLEMLRDQGYTWVLDADIHAFFDEVDHDLLIERVREILPDADLLALLRQWIGADMILRHTHVPRTKGLPQGSALSPLLANLYLDDLDETLQQKGYRLIRYSDDFVVLCKSQKRAEAALELTDDVLESLKLRFNPEKTRVTNFEEGFRFLGSLFVWGLVIDSKVKAKNTDALPSRLSAEPPAAKIADRGGEEAMRENYEASALGRALFRALDAEGVSLAEFVQAMDGSKEAPPQMPPTTAEEPLPDEPEDAAQEEPVTSFRRTLYIQEQGSVLRMIRERFVVTDGKRSNRKLLALPAIKVDQVVVFGHCLITPAALQHCLREEIPVTLLSSRGEYFGQIEATTARNVSRQRLQFLHSLDQPRRLNVAAQIVAAKLFNQRSLLRRYARRLADADLISATSALSAIQRKLPLAETLDQLRGYEGSGSAVYFKAFDRLLVTSDFTFPGRNRQPPRDPVNAMLSLGYTLLFYNLYAMIRLHRMNPYVGVLHEERAGHPALTSDLIEGFRFLVDRMVLRLCNTRAFTEADFVLGEGPQGGCFLTDDARKRFMVAFERTMQQPLKNPYGENISARQCLDLHVRHYAEYLEGKADFKPFTII